MVFKRISRRYKAGLTITFIVVIAVGVSVTALAALAGNTAQAGVELLITAVFTGLVNFITGATKHLASKIDSCPCRQPQDESGISEVSDAT